MDPLSAGLELERGDPSGVTSREVGLSILSIESLRMRGLKTKPSFDFGTAVSRRRRVFLKFFFSPLSLPMENFFRELAIEAF